MHIHILGICGTFMGGIAMIAKQAGFKVTGSDRNVYPPMSDELEHAGIQLHQGFDAEQLDMHPDLIVVGNVMRRGMPVIERMLNENLPYVSGPQWLEEHYLKHKKVLAVAGTHGKTTTSSMLAWILEKNGKKPGFLIGGIPQNFGISARNTTSPWFVIEADEYDCAFFDKRSKFVHYHPSGLIMNNLEYDHADIYENVEQIEKQFHHLVRTVPGNGLIVAPDDDEHIKAALKMGCWTPVSWVGLKDYAQFSLRSIKPDHSEFEILEHGQPQAKVKFDCTGLYNARNALMACVL
ncbi:MAG TPA: UDP-N-acetylmuramate:L-alanyl-gamma-D-glutamyl-meso-diaminopimelate ligase, partial [Succinivibrionaceae bacterium]|nr:UDP-N-acetylmuramate:L-alanyl-gamma-D-glutamyl-meso-diaminopimelate ligase [Succinivibrionaceae bacterium]